MNENENLGILNFNFAVIVHNFLSAARRLIWFVLAAAILAGGYRYWSVNRSYSPKYAASASFAVKASYASNTLTTQSPYIDAVAAVYLSKTFPYVIKSENAQQMIIRELDVSYINGEITATSTGDTGLFKMTVTSNSAQDAYSILLATIHTYEQAASGILGDTQITVINCPTSPPRAPVNKNTARSSGITFCAMVFALGTVLILLFSLTRKTVHSAEDLRKLLNLKCLAYIPKVRLKRRTKNSDAPITITNARVDPVFNESIRNLRVKLQKTLESSDSKVLLITSTLPNEGKTTIATNLALSLASEGKRVILIDGDLRKQSLKGSLGVKEPSAGLVEVLSGSAQNFRLLTVPHSTMLLLSGDETTDTPQRLLDSPRMKQIIDLLRTKLDFVIIDSPPAGILSDTATMAKYTDATVYVVRQDHANSAQILDTIQALSSDNVTLLGCVLNHTQAGTTRYGYGSKYGAGYGYGYHYGKNYGYGYSYKRYRADESDDEVSAEELTHEINNPGATE
ncbi:MAG: polysaccharide biosynthesis tyrosine autokinase [Oscillospiraceae bacterium]|nr:polysaccharide biosynthesis tyrosine autokinase [Oscillospiraceae bacterium]